jgi:hypothetical protein
MTLNSDAMSIASAGTECSRLRPLGFTKVAEGRLADTNSDRRGIVSSRLSLRTTSIRHSVPNRDDSYWGDPTT